MAFKCVGVIPARWGSTRFPGKPLHQIAGKPLLQHVWERCLCATKLDAVIVATDDMRIAEAAFAWGAEVALTSAKHRSGTDRAAEIVATTHEFTHVINIQGDEPLTEPKLIDRLVREFEKDPALEMITAAHLFENAEDVSSPHQVKVVVGANGDALYFSRGVIPFVRDSDAAVPCLRHQGIYGYTRKLLLRFVRWKPSPLERVEALEQLRALENGVRIRVVVTGSGSPGVDTRADVETVERELLSRQRSAAAKKRRLTR
ncbi:MAG: 3-deoxy-manno-octulosonate cytidylyltransferase [Chthoniobacterales bacterium]|nr:3-deoxy-manno-octulosonate cytidylyltransferase [Chthoniobacterales bacterium]